MKKELMLKLHNNFEGITQKEGDIEFWYARDLQKLLGYTEWRNFFLVIDKAIQACENSKIQNKMRRIILLMSTK